MEANAPEPTPADSGSDGASPAARHKAIGGWLLLVLALAFVNYAAGGLGLLLAIPPGFASAVFPPSGIALAALLIWGNRLWPGILLGSIAFNLHLSLEADVDITWLAAAPVAISIAAGSTIQALLASRFICRYTHAPTRLTLESDVLTLLVLGGPVGCLFAASWGVATLFLAGVHTEGTVLYTWFTWWIGDTIGVLIFTPLVLSFFARPRALWRPRLLSVAVPLTIAFTLVVIFYAVVSERTEESIAAGFRRRVEVLDRGLENTLLRHAETLWSIRSFFAGSQAVSREEFEIFVARSLSAHTGVKGLAWNPQISGTERDEIEDALKNELGPEFEIRSRDSSGQLVRAPEAEQHVFVQYIEPRRENEPAIGFDIYTERTRRGAIERARDSGQPAATERIELVQDPNGGFGFLLILPIYETDATPKTLDARRAAVRGFAVAVIQVDAVIDTALAGLPIDGVEFSIWDTSAPAGSGLLGSRPSLPPAPASGPAEGAYTVSFEHDVGGRSWLFHYVPSAAYVAAQPTWQAWAVLAGGLSCTGLLGALLLVITGRAALETARRAEFAEINRRLELTNEELAGFAYAASHDLRSPLRAVSQIAAFIISDHGDAMPKEARAHLELICDRIARMTRLLDDLLEYSRAGWLKQKPDAVDTGELVDEIAALMVDRDRFQIRGVDLPKLYTASVPLEQVLRNLCSNAIKHHDRDSGEIEVHCVENSDGHTFAVRDDGPGIPKEDQERVFDMFQRGTTRSGPGGSGMGLSLVRKIVKNRGGEVWIDSDGGRGTTIQFTWPSEPEEIDTGA